MHFTDYALSIYNSAVVRAMPMTAFSVAIVGFVLGYDLFFCNLIVIPAVYVVQLVIAAKRSEFMRGSGPFFQRERVPFLPKFQKYSF